MQRLLSLLTLVLLLVGCRSAGPTVNPFMGSATVPAQPTGSIGAGNTAPPYYPPNVSPGQPTGMPPAGPYGAPANMGQQQWMPQGSIGNNPANGQYAAVPNAYQSAGNVVDLDAQMKNSANSTAMYDPQVQLASANSNSLVISNPITSSNPQESAVRVPTDSSPLVTHRQQLPPVVQFAPVAAPQPQPQYSPTVYNTQAGYAQTIIPAQRSVTPVTALSSSSGQQLRVAPQGTPASLVYGVTQQEIQPQYQQQAQLQPIPQYQPATVASRSNGVPTLAAGPTLAVAQTPVTRIMPAVDFTDLPPARGVIR